MTNESPIIGLLVCCGCIGLVLAMYITAYKDNFLSVSQMKQSGFQYGIPILGHGGLLNDPFLALCIGFIFWKYGSQWSWHQITLAFLIGTTTSVLIHQYAYVPGGLQVPEALTYDGKLTKAGEFHRVFFAIALGTLILFFFFTPHINPTHLFWITLFVGFHIFVGNHMVLGMIRPAWMGKNYLADTQAWISIVTVWALLAMRYWVILRRA